MREVWLWYHIDGKPTWDSIFFRIHVFEMTPLIALFTVAESHDYKFINFTNLANVDSG